MFLVNLIFAVLGLGGGYLATNFLLGPADSLKCFANSGSLLPVFPDPCLTIFGTQPASAVDIATIAGIFALLAFGGANLVEWGIAKLNRKS